MRHCHGQNAANSAADPGSTSHWAAPLLCRFHHGNDTVRKAVCACAMCASPDTAVRCRQTHERSCAQASQWACSSARQQDEPKRISAHAHGGLEVAVLQARLRRQRRHDPRLVARECAQHKRGRRAAVCLRMPEGAVSDVALCPSPDVHAGMCSIS